MKDFSAMQNMLKNSGKASEIINSISAEDSRKLESLVDKKELEKAVANGDMKTMESMLRQVLNTGEGRALAQKISGIMGTK